MPAARFRDARTMPRLVVLLAAILPLGGCYVLHAVRGQVDLNARRRPIAAVIASPATPAALKAQLELATRLRDYASRELALPDNASYRYYADVGRPFVVWNVFATPEFSVEPRTWCFPVAGCVAYRGYFDESRARRFALGLEARGEDVAVTGVPAYSTLGHFADPVLNTMLRWDESQLAAVIFHELAHQRVYVKGDSAFNEAFATVVEREGVRRWLLAAGKADALAVFTEREARYGAVAALFAETRARLRTLYGRAMPAAAKREAKAAEFAALRAAYRERRDRLGGGYDGLFGPELNNALLLAVATYEDCVPGLSARLAAVGGDLSRFYSLAARLAKLDRRTRREQACAVARDRS